MLVVVQLFLYIASEELLLSDGRVSLEPCLYHKPQIIESLLKHLRAFRLELFLLGIDFLCDLEAIITATFGGCSLLFLYSFHFQSELPLALIEFLIFVDFYLDVWQGHGSFVIVLFIDHALQILWYFLRILLLYSMEPFGTLLTRIGDQVALSNELGLFHEFLYFFCLVHLTESLFELKRVLTFSCFPVRFQVDVRWSLIRLL